MSQHLKNSVISALKNTCATFVTLPPDSSPHTKGVRYFRSCIGIKAVWGVMNDRKIGAKRRKHIIARPSRFRSGLFELYTYHFPTHWSAACVANRELIKMAQKQAHALEKDHSMEALEWRIRFLMHYFRVFKGHQPPEKGLKPYARFYQYTYVSIYRALQAAAKEQQSVEQHHYVVLPLPSSNNITQPHTTSNDVAFEPIPIRRLQSFARRRQAFNRIFHGALTPLII